MWARNLLIGCGVVAVGLAVAAGVQIASPQAAPAKPETTAERNYIHLRHEYGFTTDLTRVRAIDATNRVSDYGFPMSSHERALFRARQQLGVFVGTVDAVVSKNPAYAGIWLEQKGAGAIVIGWTSTLTPAESDRVSAVVPRWVPIRFQHEKHTYAELAAVQKRIGDRMRPGDGIVDVGVDVIHNRVDASALTSAGAAALAARFPPGVVHATKGTASLDAGGGAMPAAH